MSISRSMETLPQISESLPGRASNRACEPCRLLKVRCLPVDTSAPARPGAQKCARCLKSGKECVFASPKRRRQRKRTDTRVADLEKEVRTLRSFLKRRDESTPEDDKEDVQNEDNSQDSKEENRESMSPSSKDNENNLILKNGVALHVHATESPRSQSTSKASGKSEDVSWQGQGQQPTSLLPSDSIVWSQMYPPGANHVGMPATRRPVLIPDVVESGVVSMEIATKLFQRYNDELVVHYPIVPIPRGITADQVRRSRPILFLSIISAAAASTSEQHVYQALNTMNITILTENIFMKGKKSLELIQALLITAVWDYPLDDFEHLKFYQYFHIAATMALDIGIDRKTDASQNFRARFPDSTNETCPMTGKNRAGDPLALEYDILESRRTLLSCYLCCASISVSTHRPNILRFTNWMSTCIEYLEASSLAAPTDHALVASIKLQRIAEEFATAFRFDEPSAMASLSEPRTQLSLKGFERQLQDWKSTLPLEVMHDTLAVHHNLNSIYLHEISLHSDGEYYIKDCKVQYLLERPGDSTKPRAPLSPAFVDAIMACVDSAHSLLDVMLGMSTDVLRAIPIVNFVRLSYSVTILIKLSISAGAPSSEISKILDPQSLKVNMYLEKLVAHLLGANGPGKCRPATKFLMILLKLKAWYHQATDPSRLSLNYRSNTVPSGQPKSTGNPHMGKVPKSNELPRSLAIPSTLHETPSSTPMQLEPDFQSYGKYQQASGPVRSDELSDKGFVSAVGTDPDMYNSNSSKVETQPRSVLQSFQSSILPAFDNSMPVPMDFDPSAFAPFDSMELTTEAIDNWLASDPVFDGLDYGDALVTYD